MRQLFLVALLLGTLTGPPQLEIDVPEGKPVMIDGRIEASEWSDAATRELPNGMRFFAKHSNEYVWLAIALPDGADGATDLYVSPGAGEIYDLHASAKLGERKLRNTEWPEWSWWTNRGWTANVSRVENFSQPSFLPTSAREYQIRRDKFATQTWKVMFEVLTPAKPEWRTTAYPAQARNLDTTNWWTLTFIDK